MIFVMYSCFNDTATTEIYTYCHTLSLHDALPIFQNLALFSKLSVLDNVLIGAHARTTGNFVGDALRLVGVRRREAMLRDEAMRSEEHTSELQSLMRISYAVFCLKNKKIIKLTTNCITSYNSNLMKST